MPFGIIVLILIATYYNFLELERFKPFQPKKFVAFFGMERVNPFQPKKIVAYERQN
jgi:hypothetical protein